jgi:hypothetical protein
LAGGLAFFVINSDDWTSGHFSLESKN